MKNKISKILGVGLTTVLAVASGMAFLPAANVAQASPGQLYWETIGTPSRFNNVIVPGSDIWDFAVAPDGDTVYAIGEITDADDGNMGRSWIGLSGSFYFDSGEVSITRVSDKVASISGTLYGDTCYLLGDFTAILYSVTVVTTAGSATGIAAITGAITGDPETTDTTDELSFSGKLYGSIPSGLTTETATSIVPYTICVDEYRVGSVNSGVVSWDWGWFTQPRVWKTTDGGETWSDIMANVQAAANLPGPVFCFYNTWREVYGGVAVAPDDADWVVVLGEVYYPPPVNRRFPAAVASKDGGTNFVYCGPMVDAGKGTVLVNSYDVAVAPEVDGIHNIAVAGVARTGNLTGWSGPPIGTVYRLEAGTWLTGAWVDTSFYEGWGIPDPPNPNKPLVGVVAVAFSTNFDLDGSVLCMGVDSTNLPYLQSGVWEVGGYWNDEAGFPPAVQINDEGKLLLTGAGPRAMGLALPEDYDGTDPLARTAFVYVNAFHTDTFLVGGYLFRVDGSAVSPRCGPPANPLLASIAFNGDAATGKAMVGVYCGWEQGEMGGKPVKFTSCAGVQVYHTVELDVCCPTWYGALKPPSGPYMAVVAYTPDGEKAYATTSGEMGNRKWKWNPKDYWGGLCDESAFSVSLDDGDSWNQYGLIDTDIDFISDIAVSPDCQTAYISTINNMECIECCGKSVKICQVSDCDSVWRSQIDDTHEAIGVAWQRVWHGEFSTGQDDPILLRLAPDEDDGATLWLGDYGTKDLYYSLDFGQLWTQTPPAKINIQDFALESEKIVYVLDAAGKVSKSINYGRRPTVPVNTLIGSGHTIAVLPEDNVLVGGAAGGKVAYSDDGGATFSLTGALPATGKGNVHVAFDTFFDENSVIYAAISDHNPAATNLVGGIYRWEIGQAGINWYGLNALLYDYYGIELATEGTLYAPYIGPPVAVVGAAATASGTVTVFGTTSSKLAVGTLTAEAITTTAGAFIDGEQLLVTGAVLSATSTTLIEGDISVTGATSGASGIIEDVDLTVSGFTATETVVVMGFVLTADVAVSLGTNAGVARCLTPAEPLCCGAEDWDYLKGCLTASEGFTTEPSALRLCGCLTADTNTFLWAIDNEPYDMAMGALGTVWQYEDCVAKAGPTLKTPINDAKIAADPCECYNAPFALSWERLCLACEYDVQIAADADFTILVIDERNYLPGDPEHPAFIVGKELACAATFYWRVRSANAEFCGDIIHSPWSEVRSFTVEIGPFGGVTLLAPAQGATDVAVTNVGFTWSGVTGATGYRFLLSGRSDVTVPLVSTVITSTGYTYTGTLDNSTPYYWRVSAMKDDTILGTSAIGTFTTVAVAVPPTPPVVIEEVPPAAPPVIKIPPAQMITPTWIYAIIGVGAALAIVVIVLIVRTRRPPA